jgi:carbonic anhydrase
VLQAQHGSGDLARIRAGQAYHAYASASGRSGDGDDRVIQIGVERHAPIVNWSLVVGRQSLVVGEPAAQTTNDGGSPLSVADDLLAANEVFARNFDLGDLSVRPRRHAAVLACMDSRILFEHCLGLRPGDAHMIRNAGGIATEDAIRSLIVSHHLLDTQEFIIINHTDCGLLKVKEYELRARLTEKMGTVAAEPAHFYAFDDLEENVRQQIQRVKSHPWIPKHIPARGFVYDVKTGKLSEVI